MATADDKVGINISLTSAAINRMFVFEREHHFSLHNDDIRATLRTVTVNEVG